MRSDLDPQVGGEAELALWIAALDAVPIEDRVEWVAEMLRRYREVKLGRSPDTETAKPSTPASASRIHELERSLGAAREALREAVVVLEVLTGQIQVHPYRELTRDFQTAIVKATHAVRAAVLAGGDNAELAADLDRADAELAAGTTRSLTDVLAEIDEAEDGGRRYPASSEPSAQEGET